jgi:hypothetical protein
VKKICLMAAGVSRNKYIGTVVPFGVLPFRLNVGPDETFEICHADGSGRDAPLMHGDAITLKKSGTEGYLDMNGLKLSPVPSPSTCIVVEKQDVLQGNRINDGDRIGLRSAEGWLAADFRGLKAQDRPDWSEASFHIYEIPEFSEQHPVSLVQSGKAIDSLPLGPHGRPIGGDARVHVKLDRIAPPGGIIVSFHLDSPEYSHIFIPCILLDGVREGFSPIYFARTHEIPESGVKLNISAEILCTGEHSARFYGHPDGLAQTGSISLSVHRLTTFGPTPSMEPQKRGPDRRAQDRRMHDRRGLERRLVSAGQRRYGFDNHFLDRGKPSPTQYA